jgi:mannitol 2-dehydrogenase
MLPDGIARPSYDRSRPDARHRAYRRGQFPPRAPGLVSAPADAAGDAQDWAIIGAGVRPYDAAMREKLLAQDCLTTLIELAPTASSAEVTAR